MEIWDDDKSPNKVRFFEGLYALDTAAEDSSDNCPFSLLISQSKKQGKAALLRHRRNTIFLTTTKTAPTRTVSMPNLPTPGSSAPTKSASPQAPKSLSAAPPRAPSPPPESARVSFEEPAKSTAKTPAKKRPISSVASVPLVPEPRRIFKDFCFYFVPNDINKNPGRRMRVKKAHEYGAFCLKEWREKNITHVIVDKGLKYADVLKYLKLDSIPEHVIVVNEDYSGDCLHFGRIVDHDQPLYKVEGHTPPPPSTSIKEKTPEPIVSPTASPSPTQSSERPLKKPRTAERPRIISEEPSITQSLRDTHSDNSTEEIHLVSSSRTKLHTRSPSPALYHDPSFVATGTEKTRTSAESSSSSIQKPKDDLEEMIEEAKKVVHLQHLLEEDDADDKESTDSSDEDSATLAKKLKNQQLTSKTKKLGGVKRTFQCMQKNDGTESDMNPNKRTIEILSELQNYYERTRDQWRSLSYRKAIATLRNCRKKVMFASDAMELQGIGNRIAQKIEEIVQTDHLRRLDYAKLEPADETLKLFLGIYGVGLTQAQTWIASGYKTLHDLEKYAKLTESQRIGIKHYWDFQQRIPRGEVEEHGRIVKEVAFEICPRPGLHVDVMGSYRRGAKDCGDIDIMISKEGARGVELRDILDKIVKKLLSIGFLRAGLATPRSKDEGSTKWYGASQILAGPWRRIDFLTVPWNERGAALIYFTGNDIFNRSLRLLASKRMSSEAHSAKDLLREPWWKENLRRESLNYSVYRIDHRNTVSVELIKYLRGLCICTSSQRKAVVSGDSCFLAKYSVINVSPNLY